MNFLSPKIMNWKCAPAAMTAFACLIAFEVAPRAEELTPFAGRSVALGDYFGTAYFGTGDAGFNLVVTLDDGSGGHVVRLVTTLSPGQKAVLSTPGAVGEQPRTVSFRRDGDRLFVTVTA